MTAEASRTPSVRRRWRGLLMLFLMTVPLLALVEPGEARKRQKRFKNPTRSSTIRLTRNDKILVVVNRETNSLSVLKVRKHGTTGSTTRTSAPARSFPYRQSIST